MYIPISEGEVADHHNSLIQDLVDGLAHNLTEPLRVSGPLVRLPITSCP